MRKEIIGDATLYLGDCLEWLNIYDNQEIDFVFADPPYGINKGEWDKEYITGWENEALRISRKGMLCTVGERNISKVINIYGDNYKGLIALHIKNGMTTNQIGFQNVIFAIAAGNIKRGQNYIKAVIRGEKVDHPSPKPIEIMMGIIKRFTDENDTVLDPFMGSGTTGVACAMYKRKFIGIEIEPKYFDIACKRIEVEYAQLKMF